MEKGKFANIEFAIVQSFLHIKENPKASFDKFYSYSFTGFFLSASPISKMSHALSMVLQV